MQAAIAGKDDEAFPNENAPKKVLDVTVSPDDDDSKAPAADDSDSDSDTEGGDVKAAPEGAPAPTQIPVAPASGSTGPVSVPKPVQKPAPIVRVPPPVAKAPEPVSSPN